MTPRESSNESNIELTDGSVEVMYNEMIRLYNLEMDSHNTLKDKANGMIVTNGTILTLVTLAIIQLMNIKLNSINGSFALLLIPYAFLLSSLILAIKSYKIGNLSTIGADKLLERYYGKSANEIRDQLASNLADDTKNNRELSTKRSKFINYSMNLLILGIISFAVGFIIVCLRMWFQ